MRTNNEPPTFITRILEWTVAAILPATRHAIAIGMINVLMMKETKEVQKEGMNLPM